MSSSPGADVGSPLSSQPGGPRQAGARPERQGLGIAAIILAGLAIAALPVGSLLANLPPFGGDAVVVMNVILTVTAVFTLAALVLGIIALVTRRGSAWGLAAVIVAGMLLLWGIATFLIGLVFRS